MPGFDGYEVSDLGNVRCWRPRNGNARPTLNPRTVKAVQGANGYLYVSLSIHSKATRKGIHALVLEAHRGPCPPGHWALHVKEADKTNNRLDNLEWGTPKKNSADREVHGNVPHGERHLLSKLSEAEAREIYVANEKHRDIAAKFGVSKSLVTSIKNGLSWKRATSDLRCKP